MERRRGADGWRLRVQWGRDRLEWLRLEEVCAGFLPGHEVEEVPQLAYRTSFGTGRVEALRRLGGREQALVQFDVDGRSLWLPYETLRRVKGTAMRYERAEIGSIAALDAGERFRLRLLAHALESWNMLTGALDRLDVDPLPHQIHLVHRILTSLNNNWLIADDVGLGKTIEVGLLLAALKRRGQVRRVLIVSPAGLVRQWQDEMQSKFEETFLIYGAEFTPSAPEHWKIHDQVIVSLDLAKRPDHLRNILAAGRWDLVIFDEGHKLTRRADGERSQRYQLAAALRPFAAGMLLLTATPHQGHTDKFVALLKLVRPDLAHLFNTVEANPAVVAEVILRNRKSEVTDAEGNFIFRGQDTHRIEIVPSPATKHFHRLLANYLRQGYQAGAACNAQGRAIGFVMTTYRKLASSSIAAIERALELRRDRLRGCFVETAAAPPLDDEEAAEDGVDNEDDLAERPTTGRQFFDYESRLIDELLAAAATVRSADEKLHVFLERVAAPLVVEGKKLLVFTEYRATQSYLQAALERRFPECGPVALIHGSMKLTEKLSNIARFEGEAQFLISTEAGGEGLNLHRACHVMVNYDLPWNPSRLVQRVGRLYRYGQKERVIVFNLHARDSFDAAAIDLMLRRVDQIVQDMAAVSGDFTGRLHAEILGDLLENIDLTAILRRASDMQPQRTKAEIEEAVRRAEAARRMQNDILAHVPGFDPTALQGKAAFTMAHVDAFMRAMLPFVGATITQRLHDDRVLELRLPENLVGRFPAFGRRSLVRVTTDRVTARSVPHVTLLDFADPFFRYLIEVAKSRPFDGFYAAAGAPRFGTLAVFKLRWQNNEAQANGEELLPIMIGRNGHIEANPPFLTDWLCEVADTRPPPSEPTEERKKRLAELRMAAERELARQSSRLKHPNSLLLIAAGDLRPA
ncbi:MAG TPA: DEAD/DEAH box helicase [Sphingomicrobium sp.]|nr:DEAD/DEAH box helicase [Sphingomicrobium sp.]